jgi:hypothetical protein
MQAFNISKLDGDEYALTDSDNRDVVELVTSLLEEAQNSLLKSNPIGKRDTRGFCEGSFIDIAYTHTHTHTHMYTYI